MNVKLFDYANRGTNATGVIIGELTLYFSYSTVIAFSTPSLGLIIRQNDWSTTTGGHLNSINTDKTLRIEGRLFEEKLAEFEVQANRVFAPAPEPALA